MATTPLGCVHQKKRRCKESHCNTSRMCPPEDKKMQRKPLQHLTDVSTRRQEDAKKATATPHGCVHQKKRRCKESHYNTSRMCPPEEKKVQRKPLQHLSDVSTRRKEGAKKAAATPLGCVHQKKRRCKESRCNTSRMCPPEDKKVQRKPLQHLLDVSTRRKEGAKKAAATPHGCVHQKKRRCKESRCNTSRMCPPEEKKVQRKPLQHLTDVSTRRKEGAKKAAATPHGCVHQKKRRCKESRCNTSRMCPPEEKKEQRKPLQHLTDVSTRRKEGAKKAAATPLGCVHQKKRRCKESHCNTSRMCPPEEKKVQRKPLQHLSDVSTRRKEGAKKAAATPLGCVHQKKRRCKESHCNTSRMCPPEEKKVQRKPLQHLTDVSTRRKEGAKKAAATPLGCVHQKKRRCKESRCNTSRMCPPEEKKVQRKPLQHLTDVSTRRKEGAKKATATPHGCVHQKKRRCKESRCNTSRMCPPEEKKVQRKPLQHLTDVSTRRKEGAKKAAATPHGCVHQKKRRCKESHCNTSQMCPPEEKKVQRKPLQHLTDVSTRRKEGAKKAAATPHGCVHQKKRRCKESRCNTSRMCPPEEKKVQRKPLQHFTDVSTRRKEGAKKAAATPLGCVHQKKRRCKESRCNTSRMCPPEEKKVQRKPLQHLTDVSTRRKEGAKKAAATPLGCVHQKKRRCKESRCNTSRMCPPEEKKVQRKPLQHLSDVSTRRKEGAKKAAATPHGCVHQKKRRCKESRCNTSRMCPPEEKKVQRKPLQHLSDVSTRRKEGAKKATATPHGCVHQKKRRCKESRCNTSRMCPPEEKKVQRKPLQHLSDVSTRRKEGAKKAAATPLGCVHQKKRRCKESRCNTSRMCPPEEKKVQRKPQQHLTDVSTRRKEGAKKAAATPHGCVHQKKRRCKESRCNTSRMCPPEEKKVQRKPLQHLTDVSTRRKEGAKKATATPHECVHQKKRRCKESRCNTCRMCPPEEKKVQRKPLQHLSDVSTRRKEGAKKAAATPLGCVHQKKRRCKESHCNTSRMCPPEEKKVQRKPLQHLSDMSTRRKEGAKRKQLQHLSDVSTRRKEGAKKAAATPLGYVHQKKRRCKKKAAATPLGCVHQKKRRCKESRCCKTPKELRPHSREYQGKQWYVYIKGLKSKSSSVYMFLAKMISLFCSK